MHGFNAQQLAERSVSGETSPAFFQQNLLELTA
jgi:hypothetical protein